MFSSYALPLLLSCTSQLSAHIESALTGEADTAGNGDLAHPLGLGVAQLTTLGERLEFIVAQFAEEPVDDTAGLPLCEAKFADVRSHPAVPRLVPGVPRRTARTERDNEHHCQEGVATSGHPAQRSGG